MIYLIVYGDYSDWQVEGFFENKEEAEQYCLCSNYDSYIIKVDKMHITEKQKKIKYKKEHEVVFDSKENSQVMRIEPDRYECYTGKKRESCFQRFNHHWISVVKVSCDDRGKAEKIAQDMLYRKIAEITLK